MLRTCVQTHNTYTYTPLNDVAAEQDEDAKSICAQAAFPSGGISAHSASFSGGLRAMRDLRSNAKKLKHHIRIQDRHAFKTEQQFVAGCPQVRRCGRHTHAVC